MNEDNFSHKEMLIQVMGKIDRLAVAVAKQDLMLNSIHDASAGRDEKIKDLKNQVITLEDEVKVLTEKVEALKSFNKIIIGGWSAFILAISLFGKDIFTKLFL